MKSTPVDRFIADVTRANRRHTLFALVFWAGLFLFGLGAIALVVWMFSFASDKNLLLEIWDGLLFIVREVGRAWRGQ